MAKFNAEDFLKNHGWEHGNRNFVKAIKELLKEYRPDVSLDDHVCESLEAYGFSGVVRDSLHLIGSLKYINYGINKILLNTRKSGEWND